MSKNYLITGYHGEPHVTVENDRGIHAGIFGAGRYVLPVGKQFRAENIGSNTIRIYDGKLVDNGAAAGIPAGEYVDLVISNASQGMNRNDLIVFQYSQDSSTMIESGTFVVVSGTETEKTAVDPELQQEDLLSGSAIFDQMALWRIPVSTGTISTPVQLFEVSKSLDKAGSGSVVVDAVSSDGVSYTATVEDLEELYNGFEITIIPNIASTTTAPTLNVNGLGTKPIRLSLSSNNSTLVQPEESGFYAAGVPVKLMFNSGYLSTGAWQVSNKQRPSATDLYGVTPVPSGGTGLGSVTSGSFLVGNGTGEMTEKTADEVVELLGSAKLVKLWANASPTSSFAAQSITVSGMSNYKLFLFVTNINSNILKTGDSASTLKLSGTAGGSGSELQMCVRAVTISGTTVTFGDCYSGTLAASAGIVANTVCRPFYIYGIKGDYS